MASFTKEDHVDPGNTLASCLASFLVFKGLGRNELEDLAKYCVMTVSLGRRAWACFQFSMASAKRQRRAWWAAC